MPTEPQPRWTCTTPDCHAAMPDPGLVCEHHDPRLHWLHSRLAAVRAAAYTDGYDRGYEAGRRHALRPEKDTA